MKRMNHIMFLELTDSLDECDHTGAIMMTPPIEVSSPTETHVADLKLKPRQDWAQVVVIAGLQPTRLVHAQDRTLYASKHLAPMLRSTVVALHAQDIKLPA